jgi:deoxyribose-phosphate aldolase
MPPQVEHWCAEADRFGFASVCVMPVHVQQAAELLRDKSPKVGTVIGFPTGAVTSATKLYEAQEAVEHGAAELDVVLNLGWIKMGWANQVHRELAEICEATNVVVKAILEVSLLTPDEIRLAADVCADAGAAFLKTGTGWHGGATVADVRFLRELTKGRLGIKAAGGIRTAEQAAELVLAGATRLGTSRGPDIVRSRDNLEEG